MTDTKKCNKVVTLLTKIQDVSHLGDTCEILGESILCSKSLTARDRSQNATPDLTTYIDEILLYLDITYSCI